MIPTASAVGYWAISETAATPTLVRANGAVTILEVQRFRREREYYFYPLAAYEMPWERSIDIDTDEDYAIARCVAREVLKLEP